jgi:hypothetical protein
MKTFPHLWQYVAELFLEREIFQIKVVEKIKTRILSSVNRGGAREAANDMAALASCITKATREQAHASARARTHTLRICNAYCFSTATMRHNITLHVHCLSCLFSSPSLCIIGI